MAVSAAAAVAARGRRWRGSLLPAALAAALAAVAAAVAAVAAARSAAFLGAGTAPAAAAAASSASRRPARLRPATTPTTPAAAGAAAQARAVRITPLGGGPGSFLLEIGGQRLLINPNLVDCKELPPERVHELTDWVVITSAKEEFFNDATILRMNLAKVDFLTSGAAGEKLAQQMPKNLAVLQPGPGGRVSLAGEPGSAGVFAFVVPGADPSLPWGTPESGFVFIDEESGAAVAYEAMGCFCGEGAASSKEGIPEEAYQVDYLVTPDLRLGAGVAKGLAERGAKLRAVVKLPTADGGDDDLGGNPLLAPLLALDRGLDAALGGASESPEDFRKFLESAGPNLVGTELFTPSVGGGAAELPTPWAAGGR